MAFETGISWTDSTHNFWTGCLKVSEGCHFCYMYRDKERYGQDPYIIKKVGKQLFNKPLKWIEPRKIFTCSWSDFFIEQADEFRSEAWEVFRQTPQHIWQILTKRPERIKQCLPDDWLNFKNIWLGITVENQQRYNERIDYLNQINNPIKFISFEPLLESIKIDSRIKYIDWVIIGGESGNEIGKYRYRKTNLSTFIDLIDQINYYDISIFFKQTGTALAKELNLKSRHGSDFNELPVQLKLQKFPENIIL